MTENPKSPSAEQTYILDKALVADMEFQAQLFNDPIERMQALYERLHSTHTTEDSVGIALSRAIPIIFEALRDNVYNFDTSNLPEAFRFLLDNPAEEGLGATRATTTILRDVGVKKTAIRRWLISSYNEESQNGDEGNDSQSELFQKRLAVIDDVYDNN